MEDGKKRFVDHLRGKSPDRGATSPVPDDEDAEDIDDDEDDDGGDNNDDNGGGDDDDDDVEIAAAAAAPPPPPPPPATPKASSSAAASMGCSCLFPSASPFPSLSASSSSKRSARGSMVAFVRSNTPMVVVVKADEKRILESSPPCRGTPRWPAGKSKERPPSSPLMVVGLLSPESSPTNDGGRKSQLSGEEDIPTAAPTPT